MSPEHKGDSTSFSNPVATRADFTYSMTPTQIKIVDLNTGKASVSSDIENVLRKIEAWHQGSITDYQIMYRDAEGYWDGIEWNSYTSRAVNRSSRSVGEFGHGLSTMGEAVRLLPSLSKSS